MISRRIFIPIFILFINSCKRIRLKIRRIKHGRTHYARAINKPPFEIMKEVQYFKALNLKLDEPVPDCYLKDVGYIGAMWRHQIKLIRKLGVNLRDSRRRVRITHRSSGICNYSLFKPERYCVIAYVDSGCKTINTFIRGHEEMHAIQLFHCDEAYEKLKKRFEELGFSIRFDLFSMEEQSNLVGMLLAIETMGNESIDLLCKSKYWNSAQTAIKQLSSESKHSWFTKLWDKIFPDNHTPYDYFYRMN